MGTGVDLATTERGMAVSGRDGVALGPVETVQAGGIRALQTKIPAAAIARVDAAGVHLLLARAAFETTGVASATVARGEQLVVPLAEERLTVGTREVAVGEVLIRKRVSTEERLVPVVYRREEVEVIRREAGQPWPVGLDTDAPSVQSTRIPLRGAEPVIGLQQVVSREVLIEKVRVTHERQYTDSVRKEHLDVEEHYRQARSRLEEQFAARQAQHPDGRTFEEAGPQHRAGFAAARDTRHDGCDLAEVAADLRPHRAAGGQGDGKQWARLREEIREGWAAARGH